MRKPSSVRRRAVPRDSVKSSNSASRTTLSFDFPLDFGFAVVRVALVRVGVEVSLTISTERVFGCFGLADEDGSSLLRFLSACEGTPAFGSVDLVLEDFFEAVDGGTALLD